MSQPIYHEGMRRLQDARDTRRIADRLAEVTLRAQFSDEDRAFIERCELQGPGWGVNGWRGSCARQG